MAPIRVVRAGVDRLDELVGFWIRLHQHQSSVADPVEGIRLLSDEASGQIVRDMYREWLSGKGFAFVAELDGRPIAARRGPPLRRRATHPLTRAR